MSSSDEPVENESAIGGNEPHGIVLADCGPSWSARLDDEWAEIATAVVAEGIRIEHIGSTAVPGLAASPSSTCSSVSLMFRTSPLPAGT